MLRHDNAVSKNPLYKSTKNVRRASEIDTWRKTGFFGVTSQEAVNGSNEFLIEILAASVKGNLIMRQTTCDLETNMTYNRFLKNDDSWTDWAVPAVEANVTDIIITPGSSSEGTEEWQDVTGTPINGQYVGSRDGVLRASTAYQYIPMLAVVPGERFRYTGVSGWNTDVFPNENALGTSNSNATSGVAGYNDENVFVARILDPWTYAKSINANNTPVPGRTELFGIEFTIPAGVYFIQASSAYVENVATSAIERPILLEKFVSIPGEVIPEVTVISKLAEIETMVTNVSDLLESVPSVDTVNVTKNTDVFSMGLRMFKVYNPYKMRRSNLYKGQLHCHTNTNYPTGMDGDGNATSNTPAALMNSYVNAGFDFMTITDHNNIMGVNAAYPSVPSGLIIIGNSYENTSYNQHVVVIGATDVYTDSMLMSDIMDHHQNQLLSYAHPDFHPQYDPGYTNVRQQTDEIIAAFPDGLNFVEVYNAVVQRLNGYVDQNTDRAWDVLLNNGRKVFGIAVDDNHDLLDLNLGWVSVYASAKTKNDILLALMTGNFVASNGCVLASQPLFSAGKLTINCTSASDVTRFYSDGARNGESVTGVLAEYTISGDETYVRAVTTNLAGKKCWSQPIFITDIKAKGFLDY